MFRTLQRLFQNLDTEKVSVGAIVAEDESRASRHLRQCALERKIPVMVSTLFFPLLFCLFLLSSFAHCLWN